MKELYEKKLTTKIVGLLSKENGEYFITVNQKDGDIIRVKVSDLLADMADTTVMLVNEDFETI